MDKLPVETTHFSIGDAPPPPGLERRAGERHLTLFRVGTLIVDGQRELCLIRNLSPAGMMLRAYCALAEGQLLEIELKTGQPLLGRVHWMRDQLVGVCFDEPIDVVSLLATPEDGRRPRMPRIETGTHAAVRAGARTYHARTCDISQGGIKVESRTALPVGTEVVVTLGGLASQSGIVRWSEGPYLGITFNRLLALPTLIDWLKAQRRSSQAA